MVIQSRETRETLERWQFDIRLDTPSAPASAGKENDGSSNAMYVFSSSLKTLKRRKGLMSLDDG